MVSPVVQGRIIGRFSGVDCRGLTEKTLFVPHKCLRKRCPDILVILLSVCQPDLAFVGNDGSLAAVIDLAGSEGLAGPRVNYYIGLLSLYKDSLSADPPEWIAEFMFPRVAAKHTSCWRLFLGKSWLLLTLKFSSVVRGLTEMTTFCCSCLNANKMN